MAAINITEITGLIALATDILTTIGTMQAEGRTATTAQEQAALQAALTAQQGADARFDAIIAQTGATPATVPSSVSTAAGVASEIGQAVQAIDPYTS